MSIAEMRPLSLGELLDRSFSYYRKHFWVFVGIMAIPQLFGIAMSLFIQALQAPVANPPATSTPEPTGAEFVGLLVGGMVGILAVAVVYILVYAVALGATTFAVSKIHLGQSTSVRSAYRNMKGQAWRLLDLIVSVLIRAGACFLVFFVAMGVLGALSAQIGTGPGLILGLLAVILALILSLVGATLIMLRYGVSIPALVLERIRAREAIDRSVKLTKGFLGRVFLIGLMMTVVSWVVASIFQGPFLIAVFVYAIKQTQPPLWLNSLSAVAGGLGGALSGPLLMIPLALLYYDLRVRKEGFDLELMMAALDHGKGPTATAPPVSPAPVLQLRSTNVLLVIFLSFISLGIYFPIWFISRRRVLNELQSSQKLGLASFVFLLILRPLGFYLNFFAGPWGTETTPQDASSIVEFFFVVIIIAYCFRVRGILQDHLGFRQSGQLFSYQQDTSISGVATFFFGIWYLQYKINRLVDLWDQQSTPAPTPRAIS